MADRLMNIPNDDTQIYPFCRLQVLEEMFGQPNQSKFNKSWKHNYKTLGTSVINSIMAGLFNPKLSINNIVCWMPSSYHPIS